jgi:hypothetical protein
VGAGVTNPDELFMVLLVQFLLRRDDRTNHSRKIMITVIIIADNSPMESQKMRLIFPENQLVDKLAFEFCDF